MPIYTRTGDDGTTALYGGKRIQKDDPRVELYGGIDELNSHLGLIASLLDIFDLQEFIRSIQYDLMEMSAYAAGVPETGKNFSKRIGQLEARIDLMDEKMPKLRSFIVPGGTKEASVIHITRSVCRRVERLAVRAKFMESTPYLNRLSDFLFTLARFINIQAGKEDLFWENDILQKRKT